MKTVLSGIQCSQVPHLGNYLGAIRHWVDLQNQFKCYYLVVDLHSITVRQDPKTLRENTLATIAYFLAAGLDPNRNVLFIQSHVPEHAELSWVLTCFSHMGELNRMTQFKDKSSKVEGANIPAGLFCYPNLMAADILLYDADYVPVGEDQKQHIELARNLAQRMNHAYNCELLKVPEPKIETVAGRIMDLQNPSAKMSKSAANPKGTIFLSDSDKEIVKKIKSAITDSGGEVLPFSQNGEGVQNLLEIYAALHETSLDAATELFLGKQYGYLKVATADLAVAKLGAIRERANNFLADQGELRSLLAKGAADARVKARKTLSRVYDAVGFVAP